MNVNCAERLLKSLQDVYCQIEPDRGEVLYLNSCMSFEIFCYLFRDEDFTSLMSALIKDVQGIENIGVKTIDDIVDWSQSQGIYPSISLKETQHADIEARFRLAAFAIHLVRIKRLKMLRANPSIDELSILANPILRLESKCSADPEDTSTIQKRRRGLESSVQKLYTMIHDQKVVDLVVQGIVESPKRPGYLTEEVFDDEIWEIISMMNIDYQARWQSLKARFESTFTCLLWKILQSPDASELLSSPSFASFMVNVGPIFEKYPDIFLWNVLKYKLDDGSKNTADASGNPLTRSHAPEDYDCPFKRLQPLNEVPYRGGLLNSYSSNEIKNDVARANRMMRQGDSPRGGKAKKWGAKGKAKGKANPA